MNFRKNKVLTHKILPIISVLLFCLFNFCIISYGVNLQDKYGNVYSFEDFPDTDKKNIFIYATNGGVRAFCYDGFAVCDIGNCSRDFISITFYSSTTTENTPIADTPIQYYLIDGSWVLQKFTNNGVNAANKLEGLYFLYTNTNIYDKHSSIFSEDNSGIVFSPKEPLNTFEITLSTTENTNNPVIAYSNYFNYNDATKYKCYISTDAENWSLMNYETFNNTETGNIQFRFNYKIIQNGTYYFKLLDTETNEEKYITYVVTNILKNSSNSGYNEYGIPQPFCTYERVNDEFIIKTQNFTLEEMQKYECLYIKDSDFSKDYSTWNKMSIGTYNNLQLNQTEYYFFFTVPANSEDCIFYFVFYDNKQQKYGDPSSMNCNFAAMNEYSDSLNPIEKEKKSKFYELLDFFKDRFGFLSYPFEFLGNLLNRFFTIDFKEPIFYIPDIKEPFTNSKIISAREFNLNSILDNNIFKTIHDYYLLFVDAFVFVGIINLLRLKFKEVSTK